MKAVVAAFNQEKALVGAFSVITNLRMDLFGALSGYPGYPDSGLQLGAGIMVAQGQAAHQHEFPASISPVNTLYWTFAWIRGPSGISPLLILFFICLVDIQSLHVLQVDTYLDI